jgi:hypothetical protein
MLLLASTNFILIREEIWFIVIVRANINEMRWVLAGGNLILHLNLFVCFHDPFETVVSSSNLLLRANPCQHENVTF